MKQDISKDVRFEDIGNLPSNFIPYADFTKLHIRPFTVKDLKLLSRSAVTKNVEGTIRAIDQTIDVPVYDLTIGDFYFIMMWHKLHSFPKTPLNVSWECRTELNYDENWQPVERDVAVHSKICGHANAQIIHKTNIEIVELDTSFVLPEAFDYPRVTLLPDFIAINGDPDYEHIIDAVQWIRTGDTLADKIEYLEQQPDLALFQEAEEIDKKVKHGVIQSIKLRCAECDSQYYKSLDLDPVNFFRPCL